MAGHLQADRLGARQAACPGEPDLRRHAELARLAAWLGFRALWMRDVPWRVTSLTPVSPIWI